MLIATIPLLVAIVGAFVFLAATNPKTAELGKLSFFAGLLVALFLLGHTGAVKVLP
jgi:hypothetical protein